MPAAPTPRGRLAVDQLRSLALWPHVTGFYPDGDGCRGILSPEGQRLLQTDARFLQGPFAWLHPDIPSPRQDYRSIKGTIGRGSLQFVVHPETGVFWCDVDRYSAYQDVVNIVAHTVVEVLWPKLRRIVGGKEARA